MTAPEAPDGPSRTQAFASRLTARLHAPAGRGVAEPALAPFTTGRISPIRVRTARRVIAARVAVWREGGRVEVPRRAAAAAIRRAKRLTQRAAIAASRGTRHRLSVARRRALRLRPAIGGRSRTDTPPDLTGGPRTEVALRAILDHFSLGPVVDLACADGAILAGLREHGIDAVGLDSDPAAVEECRARSLNAYQLPWQEYLPRLPAGQIGGLFISQRHSRLDAASATALLDIAGHLLAQHGVLIVELAQSSGRRSRVMARRPVGGATLLRAAEAAGFAVRAMPAPVTPDEALLVVLRVNNR